MNFKFIWKHKGTRAWFLTTCILLTLVLVVSLVITQVPLINNSLGLVFGGERANITEDRRDELYHREYKSKKDVLSAAELFVESVAEEGITLLKNEGKALPLSDSPKVSVFGKNSVDLVYGGSGSASGASGATRKTIYDGFTAAGISYNPALKSFYEDSSRSGAGRPDNPAMTSGQRLAGFATGETPVSSYGSVESSYSEYGDAAIVVFSRIGGEGFDLPRTMASDFGSGSAVAGAESADSHYLELDKNEKDLLAHVKSKFDKVIVVLNTGTTMELGELQADPDIDSILWLGLPGSTGAMALGRILVGDVNPSGHTVDTWAKDFTLDPTWYNTGVYGSQYGNRYLAPDGSQSEFAFVNYEEGIYVGYRYYETRGFEENKTAQTKDEWYNNNVVYPFGYGLSYTSFTHKLDGVSYDKENDTYEISVTVTNTGNTAGKEVVQVYAQTPYGDYERENLVEKSAIMLAGFEKTADIAPGRSETVVVPVERYLLASYDANKAKGYILSEGAYYFAVGDNAHDALNNILAEKGKKGSDGMVDVAGKATDGNAALVYKWTEDFDADSYKLSRYTDDGNEPVEVTNKFDADRLASYGVNFKYMSRSDWQATYPQKGYVLNATEKMMKDIRSDWYEKPADAPATSQFTQDAPVVFNFVTLKDVDWEENDIWDSFIDQLTVDEMLVLKADNNGNDGITRVALPSQGRGDDGVCIQQGSLLATGSNAYVWTSEVITSRTWNKERFSARGRLLGIEAVYCGLNELWYGGGNIHRTPFGGRNMQYYSEDGNFGYYVGWYEAKAMQAVGIHYGIKHLVMNDQEKYRESLSTFAEEQAIREVYLRAFEGAMAKGKALGVMTGFNRIGVRYVGAHTDLLTGVVKTEWNFKGHITTDAGGGSMAGYKGHELEMLVAGIDYTCWNQDTDAIKTAIENGDGYILQALRKAVKHNLYAASRSMTVNGLTSNSKVIYITPSWQTALAAVGITLIIVTALGLIAYIVLEVLTKRKEND